MTGILFMLLSAARRWLSALPWQAWAALAGAVLLGLAWHWHAVQVRAAYTRGSDEQLAADSRAVTRAFIAANKAQDEAIARAVLRQIPASRKATADVTANDHASNAALTAWRVRHPSAAVAGRADAVQAGAVPGAPSGNHATDAPDAGTVPVTADTLSDAAKDAGQAMACSAWIREQQAAWPTR